MNKFKKLGMKKDNGIYYNFFRTFCFGKKNTKQYKELTKCYDIREKTTLDDLLKHYSSSNTFIFEGFAFYKYHILRTALQLLNTKTENIIINIPTRISPLSLETKTHFFAIAPITLSYEDHLVMDTKEGFQELAGCKCPIILKKHFNDYGERIYPNKDTFKNWHI